MGGLLWLSSLSGPGIEFDEYSSLSRCLLEYRQIVEISTTTTGLVAMTASAFAQGFHESHAERLASMRSRSIGMHEPGKQVYEIEGCELAGGETLPLHGGFDEFAEILNRRFTADKRFGHRSPCHM